MTQSLYLDLLLYANSKIQAHAGSQQPVVLNLRRLPNHTALVCVTITIHFLTMSGRRTSFLMSVLADIEVRPIEAIRHPIRRIEDPPLARDHSRRQVVRSLGPTRPTSRRVASRISPYPSHVSTDFSPFQRRPLLPSPDPKEDAFPTAPCLELGCHAMEPHVHADEKESGELRYSPEVEDFPPDFPRSQMSASSILDPNGMGTNDLRTALPKTPKTPMTTDKGSKPLQLQLPLRLRSPVSKSAGPVAALKSIPEETRVEQVSDMNTSIPYTHSTKMSKLEINDEKRELTEVPTALRPAVPEAATELEDLDVEEHIG